MLSKIHPRYGIVLSAALCRKAYLITPRSHTHPPTHIPLSPSPLTALNLKALFIQPYAEASQCFPPGQGMGVKQALQGLPLI